MLEVAVSVFFYVPLAVLDKQLWEQVTNGAVDLFAEKRLAAKQMAERVLDCVNRSHKYLVTLRPTFVIDEPPMVDNPETTQDDVTEAIDVDEEEAKLFINVLNSGNSDQLCILISGTMYDDQQQIKDSVRMMWKTNPSYKTMHFLFRVEDLDADANGKTSSAISSEGKDWGYLAFSVDLKSTKYGSLRANLPTNLLKFFRPTFEEVAHLTGMRMERNPP